MDTVTKVKKFINLLEGIRTPENRHIIDKTGYAFIQTLSESSEFADISLDEAFKAFVEKVKTLDPSELTVGDTGLVDKNYLATKWNNFLYDLYDQDKISDEELNRWQANGEWDILEKNLAPLIEKMIRKNDWDQIKVNTISNPNAAKEYVGKAYNKYASRFGAPEVSVPALSEAIIKFTSVLFENESLEPTLQLESPKLIRISYETWDDESLDAGETDDKGWINKEGYDVVPDSFDIDAGLDVVETTVKFLKKNYVNSSSSKPFRVGTWYTQMGEREMDGTITNLSYHLVNFTPEEEEAIYNKVNV